MLVSVCWWKGKCVCVRVCMCVMVCRPMCVCQGIFVCMYIRMYLSICVRMYVYDGLYTGVELGCKVIVDSQATI